MNIDEASETFAALCDGLESHERDYFVEEVTKLRKKVGAEILRKRHESLEEALQNCLGLLKQADLSTGICCCGSPVDSHTMGDGHSPVDDGVYYGYSIINQAEAALATHRKINYENN